MSEPPVLCIVFDWKWEVQEVSSPRLWLAEVSSGIVFLVQFGDKGHLPRFCHIHSLKYWRIF